jgi:hypothetical protein
MRELTDDGNENHSLVPELTSNRQPITDNRNQQRARDSAR